MGWLKNMKLKDIFNQILVEVGDRIQVPPNASFVINYDHGGGIGFEFNNLRYFVFVEIPIRQENNLVLSISFSTDEHGHDMTNQNNPLKLMSMVTGAIEEWCVRYAQKYFKDLGIVIRYIKYDPKSEDSELSSEFKNRRDRLYRTFLDKFARKYNSRISWSVSGGISAVFNPPIKIDG